MARNGILWLMWLQKSREWRCFETSVSQQQKQAKKPRNQDGLLARKWMSLYHKVFALPYPYTYQKIGQFGNLRLLGKWWDIHFVAALASHAMPSHDMQRHAMPCNAMPCNDIPYLVMQCHAMQCHVMLYPTLPCHAMQCHAMQWYTLPCRAIPFNARFF